MLADPRLVSLAQERPAASAETPSLCLERESAIAASSLHRQAL